MKDSKWEKRTGLVLRILIAAGIIVILFGLLSCGTEKKLLRSKVKEDSSRISELNTENNLLKTENSRLENELKQSQYSGVTFDTVPCPPVNPVIVVDKHCNVDSVKKSLETYYASAFSNKVKIYSDGTIEATGKLNSANFMLTTAIRTIAEKNITIDSLSKALLTEKEKKNVTDTSMEKQKERVFPYWLLFACIIAGWVLHWKFGYVISLLFKRLGWNSAK